METKDHFNNVVSMKILKPKKNLPRNLWFFFLLASLIFSGCEPARTKEVNKILKEYGFFNEKIKGKTEAEINTGLFNILKEYQRENSELADMIIKMECFGTAKKIISRGRDLEGYYNENSPETYQIPTDRQSLLVWWILIKIDALPEKTNEAKSVLDLLYRGLESENSENWAAWMLSPIKFLILHEEAPNFHVLFPEISKKYEIETMRSLDNAFKNSSMKMKNEIKKCINSNRFMSKSFPLSAFKTIPADFKPSNPIKGGYILVFDDNSPRLEGVRSVSDRNANSYRVENEALLLLLNPTDALFPVLNPTDAEIIIYETYSYSGPLQYFTNVGGGASVYLRNTNVKVVNAVTQKTIFNKTFRTPESSGYSIRRDEFVHVVDYYRGDFSKEIAKLVKKN